MREAAETLGQSLPPLLAEAELLQRVWPKVAAECDSWRAVQRYASRQAWLGPR